jgi:NTE family protein
MPPARAPSPKRSSFALVLSGGGTSGVAWEVGVLKGLRDAGVDLTAADLIVGTSAGAIVGANLVAGASLDDLYARQLAAPPPGPARDVGALLRARAALQRPGGQGAPSSAGMDTAALVQLGRMALEAPTESEASRLATVRSSYLPPDANWSERGLLITALDVATGQLVVWSKDSGIPLAEAVASSSAAPMIAPPATIRGRRYMDAGLMSGTHAQLAAGYARVVVLAVGRAGVLGPLDTEIATLRAGGSRVELVLTDAAAAAAFFPNPLDLTKRAAAAAAGQAQATALAASARGWLS